MALTISDCYKSDATNYTYANCCCSFSCTFTNDGIEPIEIVDAVAVFNGLFAIQFYEINYGGSFVTVPFTVAPNTSFILQGEFCAGNVGDLDTLTFEFFVDDITPYVFLYDFEAIDLSTSVDILAIDWGVVNVNTINQVYLTINNPTTCCYSYDIQTDCLDTIISPSPTRKLCTDAFESVQITWQPTTVGPVNCEVSVLVECQTLVIPVTGFVNDVPPQPSSNNSSQNNKVDQTTRVEACSPRTANNRCQTARTMQSAIRANARRFGKR